MPSDVSEGSGASTAVSIRSVHEPSDRFGDLLQPLERPALILDRERGRSHHADEPPARVYLPCMGVGGGGPPGIPGPNLADIGQGRFGRFRRVAILEQHDGTAWTVVGRYGSLRDANVALDDAVGAGADPGSMRVVETHASAATSRALVVVGFLALCIAIAIIVLYVLG